MDETTEIQQDLFGLTPKPMFLLVNHSLGKRIKSPTNEEMRVEMSLGRAGCDGF